MWDKPWHLEIGPHTGRESRKLRVLHGAKCPSCHVESHGQQVLPLGLLLRDDPEPVYIYVHGSFILWLTARLACY